MKNKSWVLVIIVAVIAAVAGVVVGLSSNNSAEQEIKAVDYVVNDAAETIPETEEAEVITSIYDIKPVERFEEKERYPEPTEVRTEEEALSIIEEMDNEVKREYSESYQFVLDKSATAPYTYDSSIKWESGNPENPSEELRELESSNPADYAVIMSILLQMSYEERGELADFYIYQVDRTDDVREYRTYVDDEFVFYVADAGDEVTGCLVYEE